jgi:acetolactate synthase I/II/III large subunit
VRGNIKTFDAVRFADTMGVRQVPIRLRSMAGDIGNAFRILHRGCGPVLATFPPLTELLGDVPGRWRYEPDFRVPPSPVEVDPSSPAIEDAAGALLNADRPVTLAGRGAVLADARDDIIALSDRVGALLATSLQARSYLSGHPRDIGIIEAWVLRRPPT